MAAKSSSRLARLALPLFLHQRNINTTLFESVNVRHISHLPFLILQRREFEAREFFCDFGSLASRRGLNTDADNLLKPRSVPVSEAHELVQQGHSYLDVRTLEEFNAGHPTGAINIPYMLQTESGMSPNPKFVEQVSTQFEKNDKIGCRSGRRSLMAAADLLSAGFEEVTDVAGECLFTRTSSNDFLQLQIALGSRTPMQTD
ncbi:Rhodanese-like domain [Dillenia turbinata]|uniref:Rhodanese-like domain n=1 Tax=Dillenia turbinata TaxID=194707 RepID=A0AAN8ZFR0_9MAGN